MALAPLSNRTAASLGAVLDQGLVRAVYQPIVDLDTGEVVAFEALARGPEGSTSNGPTSSSTPHGGRGGWRSSTGPAGRPPCAVPWRPVSDRL